MSKAFWVDESCYRDMAGDIHLATIVIRGQNCFELVASSVDLPLIKSDLAAYIATALKLNVGVVRSWIQWVEDGERCQAYRKGDGQPCTQGGWNCNDPSKFDPDKTPYCISHSKPERRGTPKPPRVKQQRIRAGQVYLVLAVGTPRYKIGKTTQRVVRESTLRRQSPYPLKLIAAISTSDIHQLETTLHQRYATYRVHGEWFELSTESVQEICAMKDESNGN